MMPDASYQKLSWGLVARIWWSVFWRWIIADIIVTIAVFVPLAWLRSRSDLPPWEGQQIFDGLFAIGLWLVVLGWALGSALRAPHVGHRLMLVSADGRPTAPG